ncbi:MAG: hypothetical protein WAZ27_04665 [Minisyncoccia bacterium]
MHELRVTIKAEVVIVPGETRVRFISPGRGGDYESQQFFDKYDGAFGTLVGYCTEYIGILDWQGRKPGTYIRRYGPGDKFTPVQILFDGESESQIVKFSHLAVISGFRIPIDEKLDPNQWYMGELPESIVFYPGDIVCLGEDLLQTPREVQSFSLREDGVVLYALNHTEDEEKNIHAAEHAEDQQRPRMIRMASRLNFPALRKRTQDLTLLKRGNIFGLYHGNPEDVSFESLEEEIRFWSSLDVAYVDGPEDRFGLRSNRLSAALDLLRSGKADTIHHLENLVPVSYDPMRLRPQFERFRARAQKASISYWETQKEKDVRHYG